MKRPLLLLSALVVTAGGAFFVARGLLGPDVDQLTGGPSVQASGALAEPVQVSPEPSELAAAGTPAGTASEAQDSRTRATDTPLGGELISFHGFAMIQPVGETPFAASAGTVDIEILGRGHRSEETLTIESGTFAFEVSDRARVAVRGGTLDGQKVRFLAFRGPFDPDPAMDYALVGEPVPLNLLRVFDGPGGAPLADLTVRWSDGPTAVMVEGSGESVPGKLVVREVPSPIELPYLDAQRPIWLHVAHEGYGTGAILLDPREPNDVRVDLWPAADLTIRVTGPGRKNLKALVLKRHEPDGGLRHFATLDLGTPGISRENDAVVFPLKGLPSLPIHVEARGFDARGRTTNLGETRVELGPAQAATAELRLEAP